MPLELSLATGLRIGDVVALKKRDLVDEDGGTYIHYVASKTGKEGRAAVPPGLAKRLRAYFARTRCEYIFRPAKRYGKNEHLTRQACWARIKRAARAADVDAAGVSPHSLRKVYAVQLRHEHGVAAVREALQHSNDAVTRVYAYADTVLNAESDEPIRWCDLELVVDYILERLREKNA